MDSNSSHIYYRPVWTCGRFNNEVHAAIVYNLIDGVAYFFEDYSANVMGAFLSLRRNEGISLEKLSDDTDISVKSLIPFADELCKIGLLSAKRLDTDDERAYRKEKACRSPKDDFQYVGKKKH